jgi:DNA-binding NtrC family response regulator
MMAKCMFVDDDIDMLYEYKELLYLIGIDCICQSDPKEALKIIEQYTEISVVVTDLIMPDMDGIELIENILIHSPIDRKMKFIILTGSSDISKRNIKFEYVLIKKPVNIENLVNEIMS